MSDYASQAGKRCRVCNEHKPFDAFSPRSTSKDGFRNDCKQCRCHRQQRYRKTENGKRVQVVADQKRNGKFPARRKARTMLFYAVKRGAVTPMNCWVCGDQAEAHHPDYSAPLDVVWLCKSHHKEVHEQAIHI